jgi:predicted nucleotidyltransferase
MDLQERVNITREQIADFCQKNRIKRLAFFGSVLRDDFGPDSDLDVLVDFEPEAHVGLMKLVGMERELSGIAGRKVDLRTRKEISRYLRNEVIAEAEVQYERD